MSLMQQGSQTAKNRNPKLPTSFQAVLVQGGLQVLRALSPGEKLGQGLSGEDLEALVALIGHAVCRD